MQTIYPTVLAIATGVPDHVAPQDVSLQYIMDRIEHPKMREVLPSIYKNSAIETRYSTFPADPSDERCIFPEKFVLPMEDRLNHIYEHACVLTERVCKEAIQQAGVKFEDIALLVVSSSSHIGAPSLDLNLMTKLNLNKNTTRYLVTTMGCAAGINSFKLASDFLRQHPGKIALVCSLEISMAHCNPKDTIADAISHAIFADGCAAIVIQGLQEEEAREKGLVSFCDFRSSFIENSGEGIILSYSANGLDAILSKELPGFVQENIKQYVDEFMAIHGKQQEDVDFWVVHPGGRRIIEACEAGLGLTPDQTEHSYTVLRNYGNMISATFSFTLKQFLANRAKRPQDKDEYGVGFAFSPGVFIEGVLLKTFAKN